MRYPSIRAAVVVVVVLALSAPAFSQTVSGLLQKGIYTEETVGDLDAAIKIYEQVVAEAEANRSHVAQAHYRLAMCYEKKGRKQEAVTALQKLVEQFPKETEVVAQARAKLSALGQPAAGVTVRQVWADAVDFEFSGAASPDGKYLSYIDWESGDMAVRELATGKNRRLTNKGWPEYPGSSVFSPDSQQVAFSCMKQGGGYELRLVGIDGSGLRVLYSDKEKEVAYLETHDWSPDGKFILATFYMKDANQLVLVGVSDGSVRVLKTFRNRNNPGRIYFSPDGRYVAYSVAPDKDSPKRDIFLLATDGSGDVSVVEHPADDFLLGWAPDGKRLVFASDRTGSVGIWLIAVAEGKPQGAAELVKPEMGQFHRLGLTRSGSFYYGLFSGGQNVYTATLDLEQGKLLSPPVEAMQRGEGSNWSPAWSPDGRYLACLSSAHREVKNPRFYIRTLESGEVRELVPNLRGFNVHSLHWSPDGQALLGAGNNEEGDWGALRIDVQTGAVTTLVPGAGRGLFYPQWAANGKAIFYTCTGNDARRIFRFDLETSVEQELYQTPTRWEAKWWTLSPDGLQFAFSVGGALMVLPASGGEPRELTKGEQPISTVAWTPDGKHLLFQKATQLWRVPAAGGEPQKVGLTMNRGLGHLRVHPDGRQIAFTSHGTERDKIEVWVLENFLPPLKDSAAVAVNAQGAGWWVSGSDRQDYEMGRDDTVRRSGKASGFVKSKAAEPKGGANLRQSIRADDYRGKRLRYSGYVKADNIEGWARLWMRFDGQTKGVLDDMYDRPIRGTDDWKRYEIVLDIPQESVNIVFGVGLSGKGQAWFDDLQLEVVGQEVPTTRTADDAYPADHQPNPTVQIEPINLDFEVNIAAGRLRR